MTNNNNIIILLLITITCYMSCSTSKVRNGNTSNYFGEIKYSDTIIDFKILDSSEIAQLDKILDEKLTQASRFNRIDVVREIELKRMLSDGRIICYRIKYTIDDVAVIYLTPDCESGFIIKKLQSYDLATYFRERYFK